MHFIDAALEKYEGFASMLLAIANEQAAAPSPPTTRHHHHHSSSVGSPKAASSDALHGPFTGSTILTHGPFTRPSQAAATPSPFLTKLIGVSDKTRILEEKKRIERASTNPDMSKTNRGTIPIDERPPFTNYVSGIYMTTQYTSMIIHSICLYDMRAALH